MPKVVRAGSIAVAMIVALAGPRVEAGTVGYTYDEQGRLTSAAYSDGTLVCYAYDLVGNRISYSVSTATVCTQPPVAHASSQTVSEGVATPITLNVTGGAPTSVTVYSQASHGTATASGTTINYTSNTYTGADSFQFNATNAAGTSTPAVVTLNVVSPTHVSPNPSWAPITGQISSGTLTPCDTPQSIQGITTSISVQLGVSGTGTMKYVHNGGAQTIWSDGTTISVAPNDQLYFCVTQTGTGEAQGTITVTNLSDLNTQLGQIPYDVVVGQPP
jgi:YD repeat-containing protein